MANGYKSALDRFEKAVRAHEMKGSQHPGHQDVIVFEYKTAKQALIDKLSYLKLAAEVRAEKNSS